MQQLKVIFFICLAYFPTLAQASALDKLTKDPLTVIFIISIACAAIFFQIKFDRYAINHGPEILTTLGIFGCFSGIAVALLDFDTANIAQSVPNLLNGVKTAFWASVAGVLGALTIKFRHRFSKAPVQNSTDEPKSASLEDVVLSLNSLRRAIAGENDSSLITQLKLMRQEQNDNFDRLQESFEKFEERVSELGSKALIQALEEVIRDFNNQLTEQFGENFKQLNLAVGKLVEWQIQYKDELEQIQGVQKQAAQDLDRAAKAFATTAEKAENYTDSAVKLATLLNTFDKQYDLLKAAQESLSAILLDMKSVEPSFSKQLTDLTNTFTNGTREITEAINTQVVALASHLKKQADDFSTLLVKTIPEIQDQVNTHLASSQKQLEQNFAALDQGLERELQRSLSTLGQQLASLSEKFVKDYTPLTERLREIVNTSRGL